MNFVLCRFVILSWYSQEK